MRRVLGYVRNTWRGLTSMGTALVLLFLLALAAIPGALWPQRAVNPTTVAGYLADNPRLGPWLDRLPIRRPMVRGPNGIAAVGPLLLAVGPLKTIVAAPTSRFGYLALLAPILAACTVTIILIFRDQTLIGGLQASSFKSAVGPSRSWFDEYIRCERLFTTSPDGSAARRFAVPTLLLALAVSVAMSLRKGRIPGTAAGPSRRIIGITIVAFSR